MATFTLAQLQEQHGEVKPKKVFSLEDIQQQQTQQTQGNQFELGERSTEGLSGVGKFVLGATGGRKIAEGLGQAIAAPGIQRTLAKEQEETFAMQQKGLELIRAKRARGEDTSRLEKALEGSRELTAFLAGSQQDFGESLVTGKEIAGSALRLGTFAAGGTLGKFATKAFALGKATTFAGGALRGAGAGAATGGVFGGATGAGVALEEGKGTGDVLKSAGLGAGLGVATGGALGALTGGVSGVVQSRRTIREEAERLLRTKPDVTVVKEKLSAQGQVVKDKVAREAIKQGVDEGVVATVKNSSRADKLKMNQMVDILEKGKKDPTFGAVNRPSDVIGDSVLERFKVVSTANKTASKQLDQVAKNLKGQPVDITESVQGFIDDLDNLGVKFRNGKPSFEGSRIEGLTEPQNIINTIVKRMSGVSDDAFDVHNLKGFIDEQVTFGKTSGGLTGKTESILKGLRKALDGTLDENFTQYNKVNTTFSTTKNAMDNFIKAAGSNFDATAPNAEAQIGTLTRRILSNAQSRITVLNSMNKLQEVAKAQGGKFSDDIISQTVFVDDLERIFGPQAKTGLASEVAKGVQQARGVTGKLKSAQGIGDIVLQTSAEAIEKARNINPEGLVKSIRALLK